MGLRKHIAKQRFPTCNPDAPPLYFQGPYPFSRHVTRQSTRRLAFSADVALRDTGSIQPEARASGSVEPEVCASGSAEPEACASGPVDPEARGSLSPGFVSCAPVSPQQLPRVSGPHCFSHSVVAQRPSRASAPSSSENGPAQQSPGASRSAVPFSPVLGRALLASGCCSRLGCLCSRLS